MGLVSTEPKKEISQITTKILRLVFEVSSVEIKNKVCIFTELGKIVDIFENEALVEPVYKFIKVELNHVSCDVFSLKNTFLNLSTDFVVVVGANSVVYN